MKLQVLLVEDDPDDMRQFLRDFPRVFLDSGVEVEFHAADSFEKAADMVRDPSRRFDLILSDTYRGALENGDAAVVDMVSRYRAGRFCPLVVFSASAKPDALRLGSFVVWADKAGRNDIEKAIELMLKTGISQAARQLHDELDRVAGSYLWEFLDHNWPRLQEAGHVQADFLTRLVRRRAALQLAEINFTEQGPRYVSDVNGFEIYVYPPVNKEQLSLGSIVRSTKDPADFRVVITPHCYLAVQSNQANPRADYVVTLKTMSVASVLRGKDKDIEALEGEALYKKIRTWINPPSHQVVGAPQGRYWYLPRFLDVPHLYCDFLQVESMQYSKLKDDYIEVAVLSPPFAESLQACYGAFHGSVGIPNIRPASVAAMFKTSDGSGSGGESPGGGSI